MRTISKSFIKISDDNSELGNTESFLKKDHSRNKTDLLKKMWLNTERERE